MGLLNKRTKKEEEKRLHKENELKEKISARNDEKKELKNARLIVSEANKELRKSYGQTKVPRDLSLVPESLL